jgi:nitrogen fixation protein NifU and related proteins
MSDLLGLYQEVILDHSKRPHNYRVMQGADRQADGYNPLCGDRVRIYLKVAGDRISDISFQGSGCAISTASASILTETLKGKTPAEADALFETFHDLVTGKGPPNGENHELGKLAVFSGVSEFPARVKCATLAWHTMRSALAGSPEVASTEGTDGEDLAAR